MGLSYVSYSTGAGWLLVDAIVGSTDSASSKSCKFFNKSSMLFEAFALADKLITSSSSTDSWDLIRASSLAA